MENLGEWYSDIVKKAELPDSSLYDVPEGHTLYYLTVNMLTSYTNSILPGNYIDIYISTKETDKALVGKLLQNVKVLAVKDSQGRHVFEDSSDARTPSTLIFGLQPELNILLRKASYMNSYSTVLFPVPHGVAVATTEGETAVSSQTLKDFINANTVPNDELQTNTDNTTDNTVES